MQVLKVSAPEASWIRLIISCNHSFIFIAMEQILGKWGLYFIIFRLIYLFNRHFCLKNHIKSSMSTSIRSVYHSILFLNVFDMVQKKVVGRVSWSRSEKFTYSNSHGCMDFWAVYWFLLDFLLNLSVNNAATSETIRLDFQLKSGFHYIPKMSFSKTKHVG